jgi:hypothetical protein
MTKNITIRQMFLLAFVMVIASGCDPSSDGPLLDASPSADTNPTATPEQAANSPEPAIETLLPTPTEEGAQATDTPEPAIGTLPPTPTEESVEATDAPESPIPTIMNRGAPANTRCVAMRSGSSPEAPPVYQAADPESPVIAWLGNWAEVQEFLPTWYRVLIPQGGQGWVAATAVELSIGCDVEQ